MKLFFLNFILILLISCSKKTLNHEVIPSFSFSQGSTYSFLCINIYNNSSKNVYLTDVRASFSLLTILKARNGKLDDITSEFLNNSYLASLKYKEASTCPNMITKSFLEEREIDSLNFIIKKGLSDSFKLKYHDQALDIYLKRKLGDIVFLKPKDRYTEDLVFDNKDYLGSKLLFIYNYPPLRSNDLEFESTYYKGLTSIEFPDKIFSFQKINEKLVSDTFFIEIH